MRSPATSPPNQTAPLDGGVLPAPTPGTQQPTPVGVARAADHRSPARDHESVAVRDVEIVVPVYNEQPRLEASIRRLHQFLSSGFPFSWQITIADNASSDATPAIAQVLADELTDVKLLQLEQTGRGRALRAAWSASEARVVCYLDVDLSTDLKALLPLVAPLLSGHSELAIGARLAPGARVTRGSQREFISRSYNHLLRIVLRARFSDAQCGFKAVRADVLGELLPDVRDQAWFFDTELLVLAQRRNLRIHEVPVDWIDDPDSTVHLTSTAVADLRGVARLAWAAPIVRFMSVGILSTLAYALLFLILSGPLGSGLASALALAITAVVNTAINRRLTFGVRGRKGLLGQHAAGATIFAIALALTTGALAVLHGLDAHAPRTAVLAVLVVANLTATVTRYLALRAWVFKPASRSERPTQSPPSPVTVSIQEQPGEQDNSHSHSVDRADRRARVRRGGQGLLEVHRRHRSARSRSELTSTEPRASEIL
jgi:putative flippase GtrA